MPITTPVPGTGQILADLFVSFFVGIKDKIKALVQRKREQDRDEVKAIVDEAMVADKGVTWTDKAPEPSVIVNLEPAPAVPGPALAVAGPAPAVAGPAPAVAGPAPAAPVPAPPVLVASPVPVPVVPGPVVMPPALPAPGPDPSPPVIAAPPPVGA